MTASRPNGYTCRIVPIDQFDVVHSIASFRDSDLPLAVTECYDRLTDGRRDHTQAGLIPNNFCVTRARSV